jgi:hypothetical protein
MEYEQFLAEKRLRYAELMERTESAFGTLSDEQVDLVPAGGWSPAQILDHLCLSHGSYESPVRAAIATAPQGKGVIGHTFFGRTLIKFAGPDGNAAAPKSMVPSSGALGRAPLEPYLATHRQLLELLDEVNGVDLVRTRIRNPLVQVFRMNLVDVFELIDQHSERHVRQIEARVSR